MDRRGLAAIAGFKRAVYSGDATQPLKGNEMYPIKSIDELRAKIRIIGPKPLDERQVAALEVIAECLIDIRSAK